MGGHVPRPAHGRQSWQRGSQGLDLYGSHRQDARRWDRISNSANNPARRAVPNQMIHSLKFGRCDRGSAAVEMALCVPLLLVLLCGSVELGNYLMDEHRLVKAVRDGARFAARQNLSYFLGCSGTPG